MKKIMKKVLLNYLKKGNNFKRLYNFYVNRSIPSSLKNERYETDNGLTTNIGFPLFSNDSDNVSVWRREIDVFNKQSLQNYIECIPEIYNFQSKHFKRGQDFKLLDVGVRSGVGSNLLGQLFCDQTWGFGTKFSIDALDIDNSWEDYIKTLPYVNSFICEDVFNIADNSYDVCFCSHTIEHLDNPVEFVKKLTNISKQYSVFYCPFDEKNISPRSGHRVIDSKIMDEIKPVYVKYVKSINRKTPDLDFVFFITSNNPAVIKEGDLI